MTASQYTASQQVGPPSTRDASAPPASPRSPDEIRQQLAAVRAEIGQEVDELVVHTREMSDWKYFVRRYPWVCLAGAAIAGYYLVPQRVQIVRPDPADLMKLAEKNKVVVKPTPEPEPKGPGGALFTFLVSSLARAGVAYLGQKVGSMLQDTSPGTAPQETPTRTENSNT